MVVQAEYLAGSQFLPITGAIERVRAVKAPVATGLHQAGTDFYFNVNGNHYVLSGEITFIWTIGGKVVGRTTRQATGGHRDADYGHPPHFSSARCLSS
jgi:hypothetical protein